MPKFSFKPRMRHLFIALLGGAVFISTIGSVLELLDFNDASKTPKAQPTPVTRKAYIEGFKLETASTPDPTSGSQDDTAVNIVQGNNVTFSAQTFGVRDFFVTALAEGKQEPVVSSRSQPDAQGNVSVSLKLPQSGVVYSVEAFGIVRDKLRAGWTGGAYDNVPAVNSDASIKVIAK